MKRLNLPLILDTLFAAIVAFLLFFTALRFYTKNAVIGLIFGICAGLLIGVLSFLYISARQNKHLLISRDEKQKKLLSLHLSLSTDDYICKLFEAYFGDGAARDGKRVIFGGVTNFFNFKMHPLTEDDIASVIKADTQNDKKIFCVGISPEAAVLAENFNISVARIDEVYSILKDNNLLPDKYVYEEAKKKSLLKRIKSHFTRKLCAPLFWSGLALLALSYFTFYPIYYIVSGSIMLLLSAIALVFN